MNKRKLSDNSPKKAVKVRIYPSNTSPGESVSMVIQTRTRLLYCTKPLGAVEKYIIPYSNSNRKKNPARPRPSLKQYILLWQK